MDALLVMIGIGAVSFAIIWFMLAAEEAEANRDPRKCVDCGDPIEPGGRYCEDCYSGRAW